MIRPPDRRRRRLAADLLVLAAVGVMLVAAVWAAFGAVQRVFYSPSAFVEQYLGLLADGRAADALAVPGVAVDSVDLAAAGLDDYASDALLRSTALSSLTDIEVISEERDGDTARVTMSYTAGGVAGKTSFDVAQSGTIGFAPTWAFAKSPLAVIELVVDGSPSFTVNGFDIEKVQVSPDGADADPLAALPLLAFSPGLYSVSVNTPIAVTSGVAVLSDSPLRGIPVSLTANPTPEFADTVQVRVDEFLTECATQQVLQPTACPFGYIVQDRIVSLPRWSIIEQPTIALEADGDGWRIPPTEGLAHIDVDVQSLYDGTITSVSEDVPFVLTGQITILPDGSVSIVVGGTDTT
ncbi:hypothetical protein GCM10010460_12550 [Microbacterium terrae]|uniref:Uncharacterized protein n=2 Tax=Microbacterium terrae TaxID=69369 RepID=A0A0M2HEJ6_9MICO|nr:hypothetical protein RS81_01144 [Microbacterium terrae]GLJ98472.1 hypothetical protein GCM10017594_16690 [Microbacterium terrae]